MGSLKKNIIYNSAYQILILFIPLITTPYISRTLGPNGVGEVSFVASVTSYFALFCMLGVNNYGSRSIAIVRDNKDRMSAEFTDIFSIQLVSSIIVAVVFVIYVFFVAEEKRLFGIYSFLLFSSAIDINWFFFGIEQFKITVIRNTIIRLLSLLCVFLFVRESSDVYIYGFIIAFSAFLAQIILWFQLKKFIRPCKIDLFRAFKHIKGMLVLFVPVIAVSIYKTMDKVMLGSMISKIELGYYESCEKITHIPVAIISALGTVMLPRLSNMVANNNDNDGEKYFDKSVYFALAVASSMCFGIMGVADNFVPLFYGTGYDKCVIIFQFLMPNLVFWAFANVVRTQYLIPNKMDRIYIISVFVGAIVNFTINFLLIPKLGANGAAIGTTIAEASVCAVQLIAICKKKNTYKSILDSLILVLFSVIMYSVISKFPFLNGHLFSLIVQVAAGIVIFLILNILYFKIRFNNSIKERLIKR